jgi:hypothetical protein
VRTKSGPKQILIPATQRNLLKDPHERAKSKCVAAVVIKRPYIEHTCFQLPDARARHYQNSGFTVSSLSSMPQRAPGDDLEGGNNPGALFLLQLVLRDSQVYIK